TYPSHLHPFLRLPYLHSFPTRRSSDLVLLSQGRSVGYAVVGALQDPRKETLGYRDLFTVRVALRLPGEMTDLVLGRGAKEAGARSEEHTSELQSRENLVCRLLLEKKKK